MSQTPKIREQKSKAVSVLENDQQEEFHLQAQNGKQESSTPFLSISNYIPVIKRQVKACVVYTSFVVLLTHVSKLLLVC